MGTHERTFVLDLVRNDDGRCGGALAWSEETGFLLFAAGATVLATGGAGQVYRETTNPEIATGDGLALVEGRSGPLRRVAVARAATRLQLLGRDLPHAQRRMVVPF